MLIKMVLKVEKRRMTHQKVKTMKRGRKGGKGRRKMKGGIKDSARDEKKR